MKNWNAITLFIYILIFTSCGTIPHISEKFIKETYSYDESEIFNIKSKNCNYENIIRAKFPNYKIHKYSKNEIWFFDFKDVIMTSGAGNFYLLEVFSINYKKQKRILCSVKYFISLEKRINKIGKTDKHGDGIISLIKIIKDCNGR